MRRTSSALLLPLVAAVVLATALVAGAAASSATSVQITTPKSGSTVHLSASPYTAVAGTVSFAAATPQATRFYLRRDDCGGSNDNPHLSVVNGTEAADGCGLVLTSVVGLGGDVDHGAFVDFPSTDGMPLAFDSGQNVTGTIDLESLAGAGTGLLEVDVSMEALDHGNGVTIGSDSESVLITPLAADYPVAFTIQPNPALAGHDLSGIDLRVHVHGPFVFSGFIGNSGKSWTDAPAWSASLDQSVQVSLDDPSFGSPVPARIAGTSWSVALPSPALGTHVVYARATQGFDTGPAASRSFTVTK